MKNAKLLAEILNNVKGIKRCSQDLVGGDCLVCMIGNAILNGIDIEEDAAFIYGFIKKFDVSAKEAYRVLYPYPRTDFCKGSTYYNKGKKLMQKYGKEHLLK